MSAPDKTYLYAGGVSYGKVAAISLKLADYLRHNSRFSQKPVVAAIVENAEHLVYLIWACLASGICLAFLPMTRSLGQARVFMSQVGACALVSDVPELQAVSLRHINTPLLGYQLNFLFPVGCFQVIII